MKELLRMEGITKKFGEAMPTGISTCLLKRERFTLFWVKTGWKEYADEHFDRSVSAYIRNHLAER